MVWLLPAALAGLAAIVGPLVVHLLRRERGRPLTVPTVRFIPRTDQSSARLRLPADVWLLLLRIAIIACAALALARPLLLTGARTDAWAERIARVVIVDVSESAGAPVGEAAAAELQSATYAHRIDAADPGAAMREAGAWLEAAPPARREIVVLSDFQRGSVTAAEVSAVPGAIGIRFVPRADGEPQPASFDAGPVLAPGTTLQRQVRIDEGSTAVAFAEQDRMGEDGLRLLTAAADAEARDSLLRVVRGAGAHAPAPERPVIVRFPGADALPPATNGEPRWAVEAALRLLQAADARQLPLVVTTGPAGMMVDVQAPPDSLPAAEALKAALDARVDPAALAEREVGRIPPATLAGWTREPAPADTSAWQRSDESDGRWLWLAALLLLGTESVVRRSAPAKASEVDARAA